MSNVDLESLQPTKVVDARGMACPGPLLEAKKAIDTVPVGQTIGVWAGGDIVTGGATVILAMGAGKRAAEDIHRTLSENVDC